MTAPSRTWALPQCLQFGGPWGLSAQRHLPGTACAGPGATPARFYRLVWFGSDAWELFPAQSLGFKGFGSLHAWICSWGWRFGGGWPDRRKPQAPHVLWAASPAPHLTSHRRPRPLLRGGFIYLSSGWAARPCRDGCRPPGSRTAVYRACGGTARAACSLPGGGEGWGAVFYVD